jgi:hypothetical protein
VRTTVYLIIPYWLFPLNSEWIYKSNFLVHSRLEAAKCRITATKNDTGDPCHRIWHLAHICWRIDERAIIWILNIFQKRSRPGLQPTALLGGGGSFRRRGLVEGSYITVGEAPPSLLPSPLLPICHEVTSMIFCSPQQGSQPTMDWKLWNPKSK